MDQTIRDLCRKPFFKMLLREWAMHVKTNQDPEIFSNMYMEWMRDPLDHEGRQVATLFLNFIKPRGWQETMRVIGPELGAYEAAAFRSEAAKDFYDGWRAMVAQQVQDYWEQFLAARKKATKEQIGPRDWSPRSGICVCGRVPWKCACKKPGK